MKTSIRCSAVISQGSTRRTTRPKTISLTRPSIKKYDVTGSSILLFWSVYMNGNAQVGRIASGGIATLQFFDENRVDITNQVQYEFANGAGVEFSSTPEPTTFALLGTGLMGLVTLARRKRLYL